MVTLSALFRRKGPINLLPKDSFESSWFGRILEWSLAFGKWTVIVTQFIVIGAFLFRFGLDRQLTDLTRAIEEQVGIVKSYQSVEREFRLAQERLTFTKPLVEKHDAMVSLLDLIASITPSDVWLERISFTPTSLTLSAYSGSIRGFSQFLTSLDQLGRFSTLSVTSIESGTVPGAKLQFEISAAFGKEAL